MGADVGAGPLAALARVRRPRSAPAADATARCDLCTVEIGDDHSHVVDLHERGLRCACRPCALLFTREGAGGGRYRTVPDRWLALPGFALTASQFDRLQVPVGVAFFFRSSATGEMSAFYPSPAGATESLLALEAWDEIAAENEELVTLEPDVEALLVRNERNHPPQAFLVPIDACYELVGMLRTNWRGFDGGTEAHEALDRFFERIASKTAISTR